MTKPRAAYVTHGRSLGCACPNCGEFLDAWTGASLDEGETRGPKEGDPTICCYCAGLVIFANADGDMRPSTDEDRTRLAAEDPDSWSLLMTIQRNVVEALASKAMRRQ